MVLKVTRYQVWKNFMECVGDTLWEDSCCGFNQIKEVGEVLLSGDRLDPSKVRSLFRKGYTNAFLGRVMEEVYDAIQKGNYIQVVIQDKPDGEVVISHEDIC